MPCGTERNTACKVLSFHEVPSFMSVSSNSKGVVPGWSTCTVTLAAEPPFRLSPPVTTSSSNESSTPTGAEWTVTGTVRLWTLPVNLIDGLPARGMRVSFMMAWGSQLSSWSDQ